MLLLSKCNFILWNSSLGVRECGFLGIPTINVGIRQKNRYRGGNVIDVDFELSGLASAIEAYSGFFRFGSDNYYGDGYAGENMKLATDKIFQNFIGMKK